MKQFLLRISLDQRVLLIGAALGALLVLTAGCTPGTDYVRAEANTYTYLKPYVEAGIQAIHPDDPEAQEAPKDVLQSWGFRIRAAGGEVEVTDGPR